MYDYEYQLGLTNYQDDGGKNEPAHSPLRRGFKGRPNGAAKIYVFTPFQSDLSILYNM